MTTRMKYSLDAILRFIIQYKTEHDGLSPSIEEIQTALSIPAKSTVHYYLKGMEERGMIQRQGSRGIILPGGRYVYEGAAQ